MRLWSKNNVLLIPTLSAFPDANRDVQSWAHLASRISHFAFDGICQKVGPAGRSVCGCVRERFANVESSFRIAIDIGILPDLQSLRLGLQCPRPNTHLWRPHFLVAQLS
jgi:hypothetical protein